MDSARAMLQFLEGQTIFQEETLQAIVNELPIPKTAMRLTNAFLPMKGIGRDELFVAIQHAIGGMSSPVKRTSQHNLVSLPGMHLRQMAFGNWRESVVFDEDDLIKIPDPTNLKKVWGEDMVAAGLNMLDLRLLNRIEWVSAQTLTTGGYTVAENGVNSTVSFNVPAKFLCDLTTAATHNGKPYAVAAKWTTGGVWSDLTNGTPLIDVLGAIRLLQLSGFEAESIWMGDVAAQWVTDNAKTQAMIVANPTLASKYVSVEDVLGVFGGLKSLKVELYNDMYTQTQTLAEPLAGSGTTVTLVDATSFADGDVMTMKNTLGQEQDVLLSGKSGNAFTCTASTYAFQRGDRVHKVSRFLPNNYVLIKAKQMERMPMGNWIMTPSIVGGTISSPVSRKYTWRYFKENPPIHVEVGEGINGGPAIHTPFWLSIKVAA